MKRDWRPCWETENRIPAFANPQAAKNKHNPFGKGIYLWGNVPAIDVLNLEQNEGSRFSDDVKILFAGWLIFFRSNVENLWLTTLSIGRLAQPGQDHLRASRPLCATY